MATSLVLVHSPSVGPRTWEPVARRLTELGWEAAVPSLLGVGQHGPPFWSRVVDAVRAGLDTSGQKQGVVLVAHSNAGLFIPVIAAALPGSGARLHLRGRGTATPLREGGCHAPGAAGAVAGQGIERAAAAVDRLVG